MRLTTKTKVAAPLGQEKDMQDLVKRWAQSQERRLTQTYWRLLDVIAFRLGFDGQRRA
jgi:hypothetical protein